MTGNKAADKEQVRRMVKRLTGIYVANDNISDAIAVGLCHLRHRKFEQAVAKGEGSPAKTGGA
jgi:Holliday junction resolvasome RuvABC endonuclease subunit